MCHLRIKSVNFGRICNNIQWDIIPPKMKKISGSLRLQAQQGILFLCQMTGFRSVDNHIGQAIYDYYIQIYNFKL